MNVVFIILLVLIAFFILVWFTNITIEVHLRHQHKDDFYQIKCKALFGLIRYTYEIPEATLNEDDGETKLKIKQTESINNNKKGVKQESISVENVTDAFHRVQEIIQDIVSFHEIVRRFLRKVHVRNLEWETEIGVRDAAITGVLSGACWGIKGSIVGLLVEYMNVYPEPKLAVTPIFNKPASYTSFQCMVSVQNGHAILTGIAMLSHRRSIIRKKEKIKNEHKEVSS
ncbi:DUF2953 domain-containing protein [Priestia filamentosa]|uniref:DUF2953 domain-containing protein n=1 Tax=Priestia filamentosa TaxID=1402861 RepID=UPI003D2D4B6D